MDAVYQRYIERRHSEGKYRRLPPVQQGCWRLDFSSNDTLGLSRHPDLLTAGLSAAQAYGTGARSSRVVGGHTPLLHAFEERLGQDKKSGAGLIFPSGFQTNVSVLEALLDSAVLGKQPWVFADRLIHASMYQGIFLSKARLVRFRHQDMDHLDQVLSAQGQDPAPKFILVETVYGMDGDVAPLKTLVDLAERHNAFLYLDESHATGLWGQGGYGLSTTVPLNFERCVVMGTFSKALGAAGGYVACSPLMARYLVNRAGGFIYTTAPSPFVVGAAFQAWHMLPTLEAEREHVRQLSRALIYSLNARGFETGKTTSHIIPLMVGSEENAMAAHKKLADQGIAVACIRPPTVPPGTSRLRVALTSQHTLEDVEQLVQALGYP